MKEDRSSRGYSGYHITWFGEKIYLRSRLEYIFALWLDKKKFFYDTEPIFERYKPDFLIQMGNRKYIFEIKYSNQDRISYIEKWYNYFKNVGIKYRCLDKSHIRALSKKNGFDDYKWAKNSIGDFSKENNPHFGFKHSEETKNIIGRKTIERFKCPEFRKEFGKTVKKSMTDDVKQKISVKAKNMSYETKRKISEALSVYYKVPVILKCLVCCGKIECYKCYKDGDFKFYMKNGNKISGKYCSPKCGVIFFRGKEVVEKKHKQFIALNNFFVDNGRLPLRKEFKLYCKDIGIPCDIRSTFGTFKNMLEEVDDSKK